MNSFDGHNVLYCMHHPTAKAISPTCFYLCGISAIWKQSGSVLAASRNHKILQVQRCERMPARRVAADGVCAPAAVRSRQQDHCVPARGEVALISQYNHRANMERIMRIQTFVRSEAYKLVQAVQLPSGLMANSAKLTFF